MATMKEVSEMISVAEAGILASLRELERATGCQVSDLEIVRAIQLSTAKPKAIAIEITLMVKS